MSVKPTIIAQGFGYLEAARWRDGNLYFSDIGARKVYRMNPDGAHEALLELPARPSGLGWAENGDLLVIGMEDNTLNRMDAGGGIRSQVKLAKSVRFANDMATDTKGRAYITQFGYDLFNHAPPQPTGLVMIAADGQVEHFGANLVFPNGIAISRDGTKLVVAESFGLRLSTFDIAADGSLSNQRVFADFGNDERAIPDGLCMDAEGAVWVGMPFLGEFWRVRDGGDISDRIRPAAPYTYCVDCALGGKDGQTLFMLCADTDVNRLANDWDSTASVQAMQVEVPSA